MTISAQRLSTLFFVLFFISVALHKTNYLLAILTGINLQALVGVSLLILPTIFYLLSYIFTNKRNLIPVSGSPAVLFLFLYSHVLALVGLLSGNVASAVLTEVWAAWLVFLSYLLSKDAEKWSLFESKLHYLYYIFASLVVAGFFYPAEHFMELGLEYRVEGATTATVAYQIAPILDFWPLLFLIKLFRSQDIKSKLAAFMPLFIYLIIQVVFLKRAPTVRALTFIGVATTLYFMSKGDRNFLIKIFVFLGVFGFLSIFTVPDALYARFMTLESVRQNESMAMLEQMSTLQHIFGKGLGGYFFPAVDGVQKNLSSGQIITHIGIAYPYLKGGLVLTIVISYIYFGAVIRGLFSLKRLTPEQRAGLCFLIVYGVFRLIEGPFSTGMIFDGVLLGLSLGVLSLPIRQSPPPQAEKQVSKLVTWN